MDDCYALPAGTEWTPVDVALDRLRLSLGPVTPYEEVPLAEAAGRILALPAVAQRANPPVTNSAVDGYAFAWSALPALDETGMVRMPLAEGRAAAGHPAPDPLAHGHAIRILTGAALPEGADTIVLQEDCALEGATLRFRPPGKAGANRRRAGEDAAKGDALLEPGRRLAAQDLARLAVAGVATVGVRRRLRVAVLSTGDELVQPGDPDNGVGIFDANRPMLLALIEALGHQPVDLGAVPDDADALRAALDEGAAADAILTTGGASAGDEDHVSRLLTTEGAVSTWRIAVKPGRPLAIGTWHGKTIFGLPGNPVAAWVCALVFARPALSQLAGGRWETPRGYEIPAAFEKRKKAGRREYLRARIDEDGRVEVFRSEGSGLVGGLSWAEGLVELPDEAMTVRPDDPVRYIPWSGFGIGGG
ncbi:MAG: gephyrin-like molybdotransferase Glp [Pseudomonadota bacterium]